MTLSSKYIWQPANQQSAKIKTDAKRSMIHQTTKTCLNNRNQCKTEALARAKRGRGDAMLSRLASKTLPIHALGPQ
jgi:hypothetical protein